jgi:hypothetical protein
MKLHLVNERANGIAEWREGNDGFKRVKTFAVALRAGRARREPHGASWACGFLGQIGEL